MTRGDCELQALNTLHLRARARGLQRVADLDTLRAALRSAGALGLPVIPLGQGSNVVLCEQLEALVLKLEMRGKTVLSEDSEQVCLRVAAGEDWHGLVVWCLDQGYYGLENLALIPGTVGAAPIQNIGAYGRELAPFVSAVHALRCADGSELLLSREDCEFGYRDSVFKHRLRDAVVITHLDLQLPRRDLPDCSYPGLQQQLVQQSGAGPATARAVFDAVVALRRAKLPDPAREHNAGSFFKNPMVDRARAEQMRRDFPALPVYPVEGAAKLSAAWLIEQAGWKGVRRDGVGVHPGHALVLVNYGADDGDRLLQLARDIQSSVAARFAIELEIEPRVYGRME
ncbi:UDP-N-acetylmuramate dehydrogenase [Kineobactrum salinum]|uniref:UDP-N-acetylmuramate dehydrogenase n=1 Tax=Kineobactrum salinum TaxID=2708301 RepID=UPI0018D9D2B0|nr:UDP-N-acetylmuramate dehydrogenase [Kineobactrum salinum]